MILDLSRIKRVLFGMFFVALEGVIQTGRESWLHPNVLVWTLLETSSL